MKTCLKMYAMLFMQYKKKVKNLTTAFNIRYLVFGIRYSAKPLNFVRLRPEIFISVHPYVRVQN